MRFLHLELCYVCDPFHFASSLSELILIDCDGLAGNLSSFFLDSFLQLTTLILSSCRLNSNDLISLAQAEIKGKLPLLECFDISYNRLSLSKLKCLFGASCTWSDLLSLNIRDTFKDVIEYNTVIDYINDIVSRGYLPSLTKLRINGFQNKNAHWSHLEKLMLVKCDDDALRSIAEAVRSGFLPALSTLCIQRFEGYDAEIVRRLSQLGVSCHKTYSHEEYFSNLEKCFCEN